MLSENVQGWTCAPLSRQFDFVRCATVVVPDYVWHLVLPLTAMGLSAFATMTLLTKNSFLDEIRKQYVLTARAKGNNERQVLYALDILAATHPSRWRSRVLGLIQHSSSAVRSRTVAILWCSL